MWKQFSLLPTLQPLPSTQTQFRWDYIIPISFTENKNQSLLYKLKTFNSRPLASSLIFFLLLFIVPSCPATSLYLLTPKQVVVLNTLPLVQSYTLLTPSLPLRCRSILSSENLTSLYNTTCISHLLFYLQQLQVCPWIHCDSIWTNIPQYSTICTFIDILVFLSRASIRRIWCDRQHTITVTE